MTTETELKACFANARKDEERGKKHKGLLVINPDDKKAQEYIAKAKVNLETCEYYKQKRLDYKIPEEWFYSMYYCALAILLKFGIESRSQKCTALFLMYASEKKLIEVDADFIERITVHRDLEQTTDVDEREEARYGSSIQSNQVMEKYDYMMATCKKIISQCEEIVFSDASYEVPQKLLA